VTLDGLQHYAIRFGKKTEPTIAVASAKHCNVNL
jgi:hypothetical protein